MPALNREFKERVTPYFTGDKEAFATTLVSALIMLYGVEVLEWDPLTIQLEIKDDLGVEMPRRVYDKMQALITALTTDSVYKDISLFDETVNALTGHGIGVERDIPSVDELAWAATELAMNDPDPVSRDPENPYSKNIQKYARVVLDNEGVKRAPQALSWAADRLVEKEGMDNPDYYAGAWGAAQSTADEIDQWVEGIAQQLISQLMDIGIAFEGMETSQEEKPPEHTPTKPATAKVADAVHLHLASMAKARAF